MNFLDGYLQVPPERGQLINRSSWKERYITVGRRPLFPGRDRIPASSSRILASGHRPTASIATEDIFLSVFKFKDDYEPIQQWPVRTVSDCQVQLLAYKKQGPLLPTLVINISDKERKRRSSRAAGLVSTNKESGANTLWFRMAPDEPHPSLHEWARFIMSKASIDAPSPISPVFTSPFATRPREGSDSYHRPGSGSNTGKPSDRALQHKSSTATYSTGPRDRQTTFSSESPSLRSKRSDVSSPSSSHNHGMKYPTPGRPAAEYNGEFIEGWTSAQGRAGVTSPTRQLEMPPPTAADVNAPPAPGETILDRAFKLGHIPFAEEHIPGQEKLSSIARFDALMREAEDRRKQREAAERREQMAMRSAFDDDDSSDESASEDSGISSDDEELDTSKPLMSPSAERALAFIASRHGEEQLASKHRPSVSRNHLSFHASSSSISQLAPARPHTSHAKARPINGRTQSTPQLVPLAAPDASTVPRRVNTEKRHSHNSNRLSVSDITKRLSSSSSLLLVQTNVSGGSSRASMEIEPNNAATHRTNLAVRPSPNRRDEQQRKCAGWRGSVVGVVGTEGGFL